MERAAGRWYLLPPQAQPRFCTRAETITILVFFMGGGKESRTNSCCHKNKLFPRCSSFVFSCISPNTFEIYSKVVREHLVVFVNTKAVPGDPWKTVWKLNSDGQFRQRHCLWQRIRENPKYVWSRWQSRFLCGSLAFLHTHEVMHALQRHYTENSQQIIPRKGIARP